MLLLPLYIIIQHIYLHHHSLPDKQTESIFYIRFTLALSITTPLPSRAEKSTRFRKIPTRRCKKDHSKIMNGRTNAYTPPFLPQILSPRSVFWLVRIPFTFRPIRQPTIKQTMPSLWPPSNHPTPPRLLAKKIHHRHHDHYVGISNNGGLLVKSHNIHEVQSVFNSSICRSAPTNKQ